MQSVWNRENVECTAPKSEQHLPAIPEASRMWRNKKSDALDLPRSGHGRYPTVVWIGTWSINDFSMVIIRAVTSPFPKAILLYPFFNIHVRVHVSNPSKPLQVAAVLCKQSFFNRASCQRCLAPILSTHSSTFWWIVWISPAKIVPSKVITFQIVW